MFQLILTTSFFPNHGYVLFIDDYNCSDVIAAYYYGRFGLINNWLCSIKDVYRRKVFIFLYCSK